MKIGMYFNDRGFRNLDLLDPVNGNNGVGGTQYCFLMLADALVKYSNCVVIFYHYNENILPVGVVNRIVNSEEALVEKAQDDEVDIFIFKAEGITPMLENLKNTSLKCVAWAHNYLWDKELTALNNNNSIKRIVFVGKEQYDRYIDHDVIKKSTYIFNMFDGRNFLKREYPKEPVVTYTGGLVKSKGFHILASVWPKIQKAVPNAQLYVIGTGKIYNRDAKMGKLGIADENYEKMFSKHLVTNNNLDPSVHFLGTMGKEKIDIYKFTTVGVMNPSGRTETFGLSAVEMEACGIPVVTKAANGLFDTVENKKTGFLIYSKRQLTKRIICLLKNQELNVLMGDSAKILSETKFLPELIVKKWIALFQEIINDEESDYQYPKVHFLNNAKWLRMLIRRIRMIGIPINPLIVVECKIKRLVSRIL